MDIITNLSWVKLDWKKSS